MTELNFALPLDVPVELQRDRIVAARAEWRRGAKNGGLRRHVREMFDELDGRGAVREGPSTVWVGEDELESRQRVRPCGWCSPRWRASSSTRSRA